MKKASPSYLFWLTIMTLNLFGAALWNYVPSMRPDGVTNGDAAIILAIALVGSALFVTEEARHRESKS